MNVKFRLAMAFVLVASAFAVPVIGSANHEDSDAGYHEIDREEFVDVWARTDYPIQEDEVERTWIWGPGAHSPLMTEEYAEADGGEREVQYFDKSRMEMPTDGEADTDADSPWFITQGRLAYELMSGQLQLGDDEFETHHPSHRSAAGDPADTTAPTYEDLGNAMDHDARAGGEVITEFMARGGVISEDDHYAGYNVTDDHFDDVTEHNIASVFWDFMNSESTVYENGDFVVEDLFENPYYAVGRPLTEAYWAQVMVDGDVQDVLIQGFERRVLTFTPGNPEGWEVESGNIGQHYYDWRYDEIDRDAPTEGTFTYDGEASATIGIGTEIDLTAHVLSYGDNVEGAEVNFHIMDGEEFVNLDRDSDLTGADGMTQVTVTGETEGVAEVHAIVDVNGNDFYDLETDIGLGLVTVTVADFSDVANEGSFTVGDTDSVDIEVGATETATATVALDGTGVEGVTVIVETEDGTLISLDDLTGTTNVDGEVDFVIEGLVAGTATLDAYADLNDDGDFDAGVDLNLGEITVNVIAV